MSRFLSVATGCLCSFCAVVRPPSLSAATNYWTSAAGDGMWWNAKNWSGESFAGYGDTVVFTNDAPLTLSRAGYPGGTVAGANRICRFMGADVTVLRDGGSLSVWGGPDDMPRRRSLSSPARRSRSRTASR